MPANVNVPSLGESITEATIEKWLKKPGEAVRKDESLVSIESDKATVEVPSPVSGVLRAVKKQAGEKVKIGEVIAEVEEGAAATAAPTGPAAAPPAPAAAPAAATAAPALAHAPGGPAGPAARRLLEEKGIEPASVTGTGPHGRILKEDAMAASPAARAPAPAPTAPAARAPGAREEQVVPMTPIRKTIARRLVESKQQTAMLTTFNEVDMSRVMELRAAHQPRFTEKYGIKLGMMSFFVKAAIEGLKAFPQVNGEVRGDAIVFKNYYDIGVAVGSGKGLTVPVLRDADALSFAQVELEIADFGKRAQENKIKLEELQGGTFTISNGGVYGSLLSTPILNPPQVGILGMHNIVKRPVVVNDQIVIRPMMYLALSYDHRIVDGREAVQFLIKIKDCVENPERILLEV